MMKDDAGQALIVAALCFMVLLGALSLAADWGRGLAVRRVSQNEADAAALVAGKVLATSYTSDAGRRYRATREDVWTFAACALRGNRPAFAAGGTDAVAVRFGSVAPPEQVAVTSWTATAEDDSRVDPRVTAATVRCDRARVTGAGTPVPDDTAYVEVRVVGTHKAMIGAAGQPALTVAASSRVRIAGLPVARAVPLSVPGSGVPGIGVSGAPPRQDLIWPLVRHFEASDYTTPCGQFCDPDSRDMDRITFWSFSGTRPTGPDVRRFGGFVGLIDPSHYSLRQREVAPGDGTHQLVTSSDYSGSLRATPPTTPLPNRSATCAASTWDTNGTLDPAFSVQCNIANWFSYGYRGGLSIGTDWGSGGTWIRGTDGEAPTPLPLARASCAAQAFFAAPSCVVRGPDRESSAGDWVETYRQPLDAAQLANLVAQMQDFIARNGRTVEWSDRLVARGPNAGNRYGKAAVVNILLWDCAETFLARTDRNDRWDLIRAGGPDGNVDGDSEDCSQLARRDTRVKPVDRVHLLTVAPFTFYAGLVSVSAVEAYWGGAYGDEGGCRPGRACDAPNPLKNTAFLVPTE